MAEITPPILPDCLIPDWEINSPLQERHTQMQHTPLEDYRTTMPEVRQSAEGLYFVDTLHHDPYSIADEKSAVIVPIPFATGWRPHMAARVDLLNAALGGGHRMIALPNSVHGEPATQYTRKERAALAGGDFVPLQEKVIRLLEKERIERVRVAGYSQGSVMGAHIAAAATEKGVQQLEGAALSDSPAVVKRSLGKLGLDFARTGFNSYINAMDATTIPLLRQSVEIPTTRGQQRDMLRYARTVVLPENRALAAGLRFATLGSTIMRAARDNYARFGLMRAEYSTVTPKEPYDRIVRTLQDHLGDQVQSVEIPGYGHEFGDHSVALALIEARVLTTIS